jgi:hypothetical protein
MPTKNNTDSTALITRKELQATIDSLSFEVDPETVINDIRQAGLADKLADLLRPHIPVGVSEGEVHGHLHSQLDIRLALLAEQIEGAIKSAPVAVKRKVARVVDPKVATSENPVEKAMQKFCQPKAARYPVLVMGDPSAGKTYTSRKWGEANFDHYIECGCHQGIESRDFLGGPVICETAKGGMASRWVDGKVTRAVRLAASGESVLLLLDEIYRCQSRELNVLLPMLSPVEKEDGSKWYRLCSDRPIEDGKGNLMLETLECPVENLAIVGTTNVGGDFQIEDPDPAMKTRWEMVYIQLTADDIRKVVSGMVSSLGFRATLTEEVVAFWTRMNALKRDSFVDAIPTYRTIERALECADSDSKEHINASFADRATSWVAINLDGRPEPQQIQHCINAINTVWSK